METSGAPKKMPAGNTAPGSEMLFEQAMQNYQAGRLVKALEGFNAVLMMRPNAPMVYFYRALALFDLRKFEESLASYDRTILLKPDYAEAHSNRGNALQELKRLQPAIASYDRAIELKPDFPGAFNNRGFALMRMGRLPEALASFDRAIEQEPGYTQAHINRGSALQRMDRAEEALASYARALELQPDSAVTYFGRGLVLSELKRLDEALVSFNRAIELQPDYAEANWGKSHVSLLMGDYEEGWKLEEWRLKGALYKTSGQQYQKPRWTTQIKDSASKLPKTLLIYAEAGQGDTLQHCRYIPMLQELGIKVIIEAQSSLCSLLSTLGPDVTIVDKSTPAPDYDHFCAIGSLPYIFDTTLATVPAKIPYLHADPEKRKAWGKKLGDKTKPRIGLTWSGQVSRRIDTSSAKNRSIPLHFLEPILDLPFEFHSLQKEVRPSDVETLSRFGMIRDHRDDLNDFSDTAALVSNLDLVISIDTSGSHLAGSIGQQLWVMLPYCTDYRWTLDGASTPWYPDAQLFRQPAAGDWASVVAQVESRLKAKYL